MHRWYHLHCHRQYPEEELDEFAAIISLLITNIIVALVYSIIWRSCKEQKLKAIESMTVATAQHAYNTNKNSHYCHKLPSTLRNMITDKLYPIQIQIRMGSPSIPIRIWTKSEYIYIYIYIYMMIPNYAPPQSHLKNH
jgi:hypothetical protein